MDTWERSLRGTYPHVPWVTNDFSSLASIQPTSAIILAHGHVVAAANPLPAKSLHQASGAGLYRQGTAARRARPGRLAKPSARQAARVTRRNDGRAEAKCRRRGAGQARVVVVVVDPVPALVGFHQTTSQDAAHVGRERRVGGKSCCAGEACSGPYAR